MQYFGVLSRQKKKKGKEVNMPQQLGGHDQRASLSEPGNWPCAARPVYNSYICIALKPNLDSRIHGSLLL